MLTMLLVRSFSLLVIFLFCVLSLCAPISISKSISKGNENTSSCSGCSETNFYLSYDKFSADCKKLSASNYWYCDAYNNNNNSSNGSESNSSASVKSSRVHTKWIIGAILMLPLYPLLILFWVLAICLPLMLLHDMTEQKVKRINGMTLKKFFLISSLVMIKSIMIPPIIPYVLFSRF